MFYIVAVILTRKNKKKKGKFMASWQGASGDGYFYVSLTQARDIWEEGFSMEKMPS